MLDKSAALPIYNSRNYSILLNNKRVVFVWKSTTVEIILYYLTNEIETKKQNLQQ